MSIEREIMYQALALDENLKSLNDSQVERLVALLKKGVPSS